MFYFGNPLSLNVHKFPSTTLSQFTRADKSCDIIVSQPSVAVSIYKCHRKFSPDLNVSHVPQSRNSTNSQNLEELNYIRNLGSLFSVSGL